MLTAQLVATSDLVLADDWCTLGAPAWLGAALASRPAVLALITLALAPLLARWAAAHDLCTAAAAARLRSGAAPACLQACAVPWGRHRPCSHGSCCVGCSLPIPGCNGAAGGPGAHATRLARPWTAAPALAMRGAAGRGHPASHPHLLHVRGQAGCGVATSCLRWWCAVPQFALPSRRGAAATWRCSPLPGTWSRRPPRAAWPEWEAAPSPCS